MYSEAGFKMAKPQIAGEQMLVIELKRTLKISSWLHNPAARIIIAIRGSSGVSLMLFLVLLFMAGPNKTYQNK